MKDSKITDLELDQIIDSGKSTAVATPQSEENNDENYFQMEDTDCTSLCGVKLNAGISKCNLLSFYLCQAASIVNMQFLYTFAPLLLNAKAYYGQSMPDAMVLFGWTSVVGQFCDFFFCLGIGPMMDKFGRKKPLIISNAICGLAILMMAFVPEIAIFFVMRAINTCARAVGQLAPVIPDYVQSESLGLAWGLNYVGITIGGILATTCLYQIDIHMLSDNVGYAFFICGAFILFVAAVLVFGLKDVRPKAKAKIPFTKKMSGGLKEIKDKYQIPIGIAAFAISAAVLAIDTQYCTVLLKDIDKEHNVGLDHVERRLSILFFISTVLALPLIVLFGRLADLMNVQSLILTVLVLEIIGHIFIIWNVEQISIFYDIGFIITRIFYPILQMLGMTMVNKFCDPEKIPMVMGFSGAVLGVWSSLAQLSAGYLYGVSKMAPFFIPLGMSGLLAIAIILLKITRK